MKAEDPDVCQCSGPGFCPRYKRKVTPMMFRVCQGDDADPEKCARHRANWDQQSGNPVKKQTKLVSHRSRRGDRPAVSSTGVGSELKKLLALIRIHATPNCPCNKHMAEMDRNGPEWCRQHIETIIDWMAVEAEKRELPFSRFAGKRLVLFAIRRFEKHEKKAKQQRRPTAKPAGGGKGPPVQKLKLDGPVRRNLIYHIYPMTKNREIWQWNLDQLIQRIDLFNGWRIVGIVHDGLSDPPEMVQEYLRGHVDDFVVLKNVKKQGEGITYAPMMERIESFDKNEVTFRAHAKGVSKKPSELPLIQKWTEIMYAVCLDDWQHVKTQLEEFAITGPFRRHARMGGANWFYSGAFYWFRNRDVFQRNWRSIHKLRVGIEIWPFKMFQLQESGCVFGDVAGSLYQQNYMDEHALPDYERWVQDRIPTQSETSML